MASASISIGLPVYNGENYLTQAIESVLRQTYSDFTLIISDNCSTDRTQELCVDWSKRDDRIRYIRQPENRGAIRNFNYVFEVSDSKYFKWASHDDVCAPTFLEKCVSLLESRDEVAWCHSISDKIDELGQSWRDILPCDHSDLEQAPDGRISWSGLPREAFDSDSPHKRFRGVLLGTNWCVDSYGLFRSAALKKTKLFPDCYGAEKVLLGHLSLLGKYAQVPELLFSQRIHREASSSLASAKEQALFAGGSFASTRLALLRGHLGSVRRSQLAPVERARCYGVVARYVMQPNKWLSVLSGAFRGSGVGGGSLEMLAHDSEQQREEGTPVRGKLKSAP